MNRPNPFVQILYSRKTWWAILSLAAVLLAHYSGLPTEVQGAIVAVGLSMIGSIAWEDYGEKRGRETTVTAAGDATVTNIERKEGGA